MSSNAAEDRRRYYEHRAQHSQVYDWIIQYSRQAMAKGYPHWSVSRCIEVIRFSNVNLSPDDAGYKINDHVGSFYSREIMMKNPDLLDFYDVRTAIADFEPLGPQGETWFDFDTKRKIEANKQKEERKQKKVVQSAEKKQLTAQIKALKIERGRAFQAGDPERAKRLRLEIERLEAEAKANNLTSDI